MVGFKTKQEATCAQQETDGMKLDNVILQVEMYNKTQSVRFLRERRGVDVQVDGDDGDDGDDDDDDDDIDGNEVELGCEDEDSNVEFKEMNLEKEKQKSLELADRCEGRVGTIGTLWAHVAARPRAANASFALNGPGEYASKTSAVVEVNEATVPVDDWYTAAYTPLHGLESRPTTGESEPGSRTSSLGQCHYGKEAETGGNATEEPRYSQEIVSRAQVEPGAINSESQVEKRRMLAWPVDTTVHIQQRHCVTCPFCQMRRW